MLVFMKGTRLKSRFGGSGGLRELLVYKTPDSTQIDLPVISPKDCRYMRIFLFPVNSAMLHDPPDLRGRAQNGELAKSFAPVILGKTAEFGRAECRQYSPAYQAPLFSQTA